MYMIENEKKKNFALLCNLLRRELLSSLEEENDVKAERRNDNRTYRFVFFHIVWFYNIPYRNDIEFRSITTMNWSSIVFFPFRSFETIWRKQSLKSIQQ